MSRLSGMLSNRGQTSVVYVPSGHCRSRVRMSRSDVDPDVSVHHHCILDDVRCSQNCSQLDYSSQGEAR